MNIIEHLLRLKGIWELIHRAVGVDFKLSSDLKGVLMVLGYQGVSGARPCPCCCTPRADFGKPAHHCSKESSLRHISSKHLALLQSLHQRSQSLGGDTVMSYYASGRITSGTREMVAEALMSNPLFVSLLAGPSEVHALQRNDALNCRFVRIQSDQQGLVTQDVVDEAGAGRAEGVLEYMSRWDEVVGEAPDKEQGVVLLDQMKAHMMSLQCCVVEGD
jgi:hypothetical protein